MKMNPTPYVMFENGQCREAMAFYAGLFGGEVEMMMTVAEAPMDMPGANPDWIMHGAVEFDGGMLFGCDDVMGRFDRMTGCSIMMPVPEVEKGRGIFEALADGGEVSMPYQATFWSPGFGTLRDRFGINWMISCSAPVAES